MIYIYKIAVFFSKKLEINHLFLSGAEMTINVTNNNAKK